MNATETELLAALRELQKQLHAHIRLDVKKHYSLMVADAAASTAIAKAEAEKRAWDNAYSGMTFVDD
jgi:hypothetical protein